MEPKKNPTYDIHRKRGMLFSIGLLTALTIVIMAFEWRTAYRIDIPARPEEPDDVVYQVPATDHVYKIARPQPVQPQLATEFTAVPNDVALEQDPIEFTPSDELTVQTITPVAAVLPPEPVPTGPVVFAEVMPEPEGGFASFYETMGRLMRYPAAARRLDIQGKVFVEFVVNEKGELSEVKVIRGIGAGCDEEAMRVLKLTRWKPGKQRGVPVKVRMVQPIIFSLKGNR